MTKIIKINYPSASADEIGTITAIIRDKALEQFETARISYSFSSQKNSGYIMVYPTAPILSIRVSNYLPDHENIEPKMLTENGNVTVINAEMENGQKVSEAIIESALLSAERSANEIQRLLKITKMI